MCVCVFISELVWSGHPIQYCWEYHATRAQRNASRNPSCPIRAVPTNAAEWLSIRVVFRSLPQISHGNVCHDKPRKKNVSYVSCFLIFSTAIFKLKQLTSLTSQIFRNSPPWTSLGAGPVGKAEVPELLCPDLRNCRNTHPGFVEA